MSTQEAPQREVIQREDAPDFSRGILILLMIYGHVGRLGTLSDLGNNIVTWIYTFHMPIFFLISGSFFYRTLRKPVAFGKFMRSLLVPYFVFSILYMISIIAV
jgi:fucose 4-O-acetylase-like acetyltransferase